MALRFSFGIAPELAELNASHLVREFCRGEGNGRRQYEITYNPIVGGDGKVEKFLIVVRDVTVLRQLREAQRQSAREAEAVAQILDAGVEEFRGFCESARVLLAGFRALWSLDRELGEQDARRLFRDVHTIKANARALGLRRWVDDVHTVESLLDGKVVRPGQSLDWPEIARRIESLERLLFEYEEVGQRKLGQLWAGDSERLKQAIDSIEAALDNARAHPSRPAPALAAIEHTLRRVQSVPLDALLRDVSRPIASIAAELGKPRPDIVWQGEGVTLAPEWARIMKDAFTHTLRNSLDHGIEPVPERESRGKPREGRVQLRVERRPSGLCICVSDDGRGLALTHLRDLNPDRHASDELVADSIFASGVSTASSVSTLSGRGVGMDSVRSAVGERGGRVHVAFTGEETSGYRPFELVFELPPEACLD